MKTLLIDNYDSYTYNLYQELALVNGSPPDVVANDARELPGFDTWDNVVLSPGPGRPDRERDFGVCRDAVLRATVPVLGVCLGHQGIGSLLGARVVHAREPMHGRTSPILHDGSSLFRGIPQGFTAVRYHSLVVDGDLPEDLRRIAWTPDGVVMGLRHARRPLYGVQFHPESIGTAHGRRLLENFRDLTRERAGARCSRAAPAAARPPPPARDRGAQPAPRLRVLHRALDRWTDPERTFVHLYGREPVAFWLDSSRVEPGRARFSFMGCAGGPESLVVRYRVGDRTRARRLETERHGRRTLCRESVFELLERELARRRCRSDALPFDFDCGFVGYFGYELKVECGGRPGHRSPHPDAAFLLADRVIAFDHEAERVHLLCLTEPDRTAAAEAWLDATQARLERVPPLEPPPRAAGGARLPVRVGRPPAAYCRDVRACQAEIVEGESYEICLTTRIRVDADVDPLELHRILRAASPAPFAAFLRFGELAVVSSSPERFLRIDRAGRVESRPVKGTIARGAGPAEDRALRERLRASGKDRAENLMIADLVRNDLGRVCRVGSVRVPELMEVETCASVHQMVSAIRGTLRDDVSAIDCIRHAFPGGSMTGAPKLRTMEIIDRIEGDARGVYSGAIGYLALGGAADLGMVIRTAVVTPGRVVVGTGGAVTALSDPQGELEEMLVKARPVLRAVEVAACGRLDPDLDALAGPAQAESAA